MASLSVTDLWSTPLWVAGPHGDEALHARLTQKAIDINQEMLVENPRIFYERNKANIFDRYKADEDVRNVGKLFVRACRDYIGRCYGDQRPYRVDISGYVSVQRDGDSIPWHAHVGTSHITAIFYTAVGNGGELLLEDPRPINRDWDPHGPRRPERRYHHVKPEPGMLVLFPGFVPHATQKFSGAVRVCWVADMLVNFEGIEEPKIPETNL